MQLIHLSPRHVRANVFATIATLCTFTAAYSQSTDEAAHAPLGRLDFAAANLPEANVEVDLSEDMFKDLFGIGDAALSGIAETLLKAPSADDGNEETQLAAQQLETARQIIQLAGNTVREVHVRLYESLPEESTDAQQLFKPFEEQLRAGKWETLARVRNDDEMVRVSVIRNAGSVQGVFVVATDGDSIVLANIVCDISPENAKKLTAAATKVGLENGLAQAIKLKFEPTIVIQSSEEAAVAVPVSDGARPARPVVSE